MSGDLPFEPPVITDEDIWWACRRLKLPKGAFHGETGTDQRQDVLRSMEQIDVAACPGSGKTTLLVAKLAILAEKWQHRTRGILVLSHTNAARDQIASRLGNKAAGQRLLAYPHFIGTIHGFVDHFLTLPLLRSLGYKSTQFSTDIAGQQLWALSDHGANVPGYLYNKIRDADRRKAAFCHAHYVGEDLDLILEAKNVSVKLLKRTNSQSYGVITQWKSDVLHRGYAAYEDTFAYGHHALKKNGDLANTLRGRFPLLFIDEAQDNREGQSAILERIFMVGDAPVRRQRFGDGNQAIFDSIDTKEATTDRFPDGSFKKELPNSHRFGPNIARLAGPLGVTPHDGGLIGQGPSTQRLSHLQEGQHTIFLFGDDCAGKVLEAYGSLLLNTFSEKQLRDGTFTAVGHRHTRPDQEEAHKYPHHIGHYWPDYDPELSKADPKPRTFVQYVFAGLEKAKTAGETFPAVEKIAEGILRLARMTTREAHFYRTTYCHRFVLQLLEEHAALEGRYKLLVSRLAVKREILTRNTWNDSWHGEVQEIVEAIAGAPPSSSEAADFLAWKDAAGVKLPTPTIQRSCDNIYDYPDRNPKVHIRVGSIHSVKGETHTATLVLETFLKKHNLVQIVPWLDGSEPGAASVGPEQKSRLKLHYVAMTRPTHLLCLAMKRSTFENEEGGLDRSLIGKLERSGWCVTEI